MPAYMPLLLGRNWTRRAETDGNRREKCDFRLCFLRICCKIKMEMA